MPRNDGEKRRRQILTAAEKLFSREGFAGASISRLAKLAGVNKGLVYYYFSSKNEIMQALFQGILDELEAGLGGSGASPAQQVEQELAFLDGKKQILSVMLMETLKEGNADPLLFQCAEAVLHHHGGGKPARRSQDFLVSEFFTGFLPLIGFVVLRDKWCRYFTCDSRAASRAFLKAFERNHMEKENE